MTKSAASLTYDGMTVVLVTPNRAFTVIPKQDYMTADEHLGVTIFTVILSLRHFYVITLSRFKTICLRLLVRSKFMLMPYSPLNKPALDFNRFVRTAG